MAGTPYTYSFLDSSCTIVGPGGNFSLAGEGSGSAEEGIEFEYEADKGNLVIGADGSGMHSLHANSAGTAVVRLLKNSPVNQLLNTMYNLQTTAASLWGSNIIALANSASGDVVTLGGAAFQRHAPVQYAMDGGTNEWRFRGIKLSIILGSGL